MVVYLELLPHGGNGVWIQSALGPVAGQGDRLKITAKIRLMMLVVDGG